MIPNFREETFSAIGHRVVHGGEKFSVPVRITDQVKQEIKRLGDLAPLHNPTNLLGIEVMERIYPNALQTAVFDTSFHQTIPEKGYLKYVESYLANLCEFEILND